jgi:hypothetical protein
MTESSTASTELDLLLSRLVDSVERVSADVKQMTEVIRAHVRGPAVGARKVLDSAAPTATGEAGRLRDGGISLVSHSTLGTVDEVAAGATTRAVVDESSASAGLAERHSNLNDAARKVLDNLDRAAIDADELRTLRNIVLRNSDPTEIRDGGDLLDRLEDFGWTPACLPSPPLPPASATKTFAEDRLDTVDPRYRNLHSLPVMFTSSTPIGVPSNSRGMNERYKALFRQEQYEEQSKQLAETEGYLRFRSRMAQLGKGVTETSQDDDAQQSAGERVAEQSAEQRVVEQSAEQRAQQRLLERDVAFLEATKKLHAAQDQDVQSRIELMKAFCLLDAAHEAWKRSLDEHEDAGEAQEEATKELTAAVDRELDARVLKTKATKELEAAYAAWMQELENQKLWQKIAREERWAARDREWRSAVAESGEQGTAYVAMEKKLREDRALRELDRLRRWAGHTSRDGVEAPEASRTEESNAVPEASRTEESKTGPDQATATQEEVEHPAAGGWSWADSGPGAPCECCASMTDCECG